LGISGEDIMVFGDRMYYHVAIKTRSTPAIEERQVNLMEEKEVMSDS
jgi:hypothetical protein